MLSVRFPGQVNPQQHFGFKNFCSRVASKRTMRTIKKQEKALNLVESIMLCRFVNAMAMLGKKPTPEIIEYIQKHCSQNLKNIK